MQCSCACGPAQPTCTRVRTAALPLVPAPAGFAACRAASARRVGGGGWTPSVGLAGSYRQSAEHWLRLPALAAGRAAADPWQRAASAACSQRSVPGAMARGMPPAQWVERALKAGDLPYASEVQWIVRQHLLDLTAVRCTGASVPRKVHMQ